MKIKINIVDAFTHTRFKGNSAAVIITDTWLTDDQMQQIATENNLSETAYLIPQGLQEFAIRWFSPLTEIDFCGHASLASAYVLFQSHPDFEHLIFHTEKLGSFKVQQCDNGFIEMDFPNCCPQPISDIPAALLVGLSIKPQQVLKSEQAYFAVYANASDVETVQYDSSQLKCLAPFDVVVTAQATQLSPYDFISRYFWPANGGDEDPVTGSIHAGLAPFWAEKLNKTELFAYQASKRGGELHCKIQNDRVLVSGQAVQYLEGVLTLTD
ncbi:PhzF family phenazine biosynthesis protein [Pseudoalteromonas tunicata]|uniref:Phenazine biosynthesis protein, PhzF family n=1 Tax=Pseudoalteromonas tunicata D2 TaxID=87626 RepID=A4CDL5_9GAMM|nr:PhzF family phenazine biosynthesis protein [Pseudoalteromonas tunicata]ATC96454.1 hypothetical protein PTUN_a4261 [Pseudoalteromonas tunicata]AXT31936.1 PhzF family phenazine biosynthesis protein [Pseudoalteromonas tunicata]EAR27057.1 phenazine biosynthesis protein, PhzF family [Pseudoalteromonas tunicata D2]MDP4985418.1 PhzF family phenazine biosynthesis protein [Pseudoalteromonas tunicata]